MKIVFYCIVFILFSLVFCSVPGKSAKDKSVLGNAQKLIVVLGQSWDSAQVRIYLLKKENGIWALNGKAYPGVIGKNGFGWGIGLHAPLDWVKRFPYKPKLEGDKRSPAGLFSLGNVMGHEQSLPFASPKRYVQILGCLHAVDDTSSSYYNQIVDTNRFTNDFKNFYHSYEDLLKVGNAYKWMFIIEHNFGCKKGQGSNIFFHIRNADGSGTAGCTAVDEENLLEIIKWMDDSTLLLQLPEGVYDAVRDDLALPGIDD